jgi:spore coat polysaccharide biosynthesis predicted glycosyltransferase SpsG
MFALCIESSHARGMGHFYRALNLIEGLFAAGKHGILYLNDHAPSRALLEAGSIPHRVVHLDDRNSAWQAKLVELDEIQVWVDDRLETDAGHAERVKAAGIPLATFDNRGPGAEAADLHVAALCFDSDEWLGGRRVLRGVEYLVLNPEIRHHARVRENLRSILVTLGGSDTYGVTLEVVRFLKKKRISATIVVGPGFKHFRELESLLSEDLVLKKGVPSMIEEFSRHDLAFTGGGITPFEANASGLPCVVIANELFEIPVGHELQRLGGCKFIGHHQSLEWPNLLGSLPLSEMSRAGMQNIGTGGTARVLAALLELEE